MATEWPASGVSGPVTETSGWNEPVGRPAAAGWRTSRVRAPAQWTSPVVRPSSGATVRATASTAPSGTVRRQRSARDIAAASASTSPSRRACRRPEGDWVRTVTGQPAFRSCTAMALPSRPTPTTKTRERRGPVAATD